MHYFPDGTVDSYGNQLPAGTYTRVLNGVEYVVYPNDPRIKERIEAEYKAQEAVKQPQQQASPQTSAMAAEAAPKVGIQARVDNNSQQPQAPDEENWEGAYEPPQEREEYVHIPNSLFDTDEIDTSDYDNFNDFIDENGLYYDFYVDYNEDGERVRYARIYDKESDERIVTLSEGRDFFYTKDGVFFTKSFSYNNTGRKILELRAGIHVGDDAKELFEGLGYEISISGDTIFIKDERGKVSSFARGEEFSATKNGIFIAPGALNSKTIQDLLKDSPKSRIKVQVLDYAERILRADDDITQEDLDYLAANMSLLEGDTEVEAALEELFNDEEFAAAWEERANQLEHIEETEDELTVSEMLVSALIMVFTGELKETGNKAFDNTLRMVSFAMLLTPAGIGRKLLGKVVGKAVTKLALTGILKLAQRFFSKKENIDRVKDLAVGFFKKADNLKEVADTFDEAYTGFFGYCNLIGVEVPTTLTDLVEQVIDELRGGE